MKAIVVGAGYWGPNIVRNLVEFPEVESIGISDLDPERAQKLVKKFPRTHVARTAPDAFRDGYDVAFIITPVETHAALAKEALRAGLHTFVEKPLTRTVEEGRELIDVAKQSGKRLMVGHVFHYKPAVRTLVDLARSGELGNIKYLDSVRVNLGQFRPDVNVMWDLAPHDLTIFEAILGKTPKRVSAIGACHVPGPDSRETMTYLMLDYGDGCLGHVHSNWFSPLKQRLMVVAGDKKMAVFDDIDPIEPIRVYDRGTYDPEHDKADPVYVQLRSGDTHLPFVKNQEPLKLQIREFFDAIEAGRNPETDGEAGLRLVRILETAMKSLNQDGRFVPIDEVL